MNVWKECKWGSVATLEYGKGLQDYRNLDGKYPVYGTNGKIGTAKDFLCPSSGVIIGRKGAYREVHYSDRPFYVIDTAFYLKPLIKDLNIRFAYYNLLTVDINAMDSGSAIPSTSREEFYDLNLILPPLNEQNAIVEFLSSLDDKIDFLHRQNKTLEQLAATLFRQWFVEEAEETWKEITLSELAEHLKESVNPSKDPDKLFKHYSIPSFDEGKEPILELGKDILSNKNKVVSNSILVSKLNPRTPRIWMMYGSIEEHTCICSTEFQVVKPKDKTWFGFLYCFLKSYRVTQELAGASSGTSGSHQRINPQDIFNLTLLKPDTNLINKFDDITKEYWEKLTNNHKKIQTLTQLRDTLLPKLMSGAVRVEV